jgi:hypothetical protein
MAIKGTVDVRCAGCGLEQRCTLIQSIDTIKEPAAKQQLLDGTLNVLACACTRRTQLESIVVFHDPAASFLCQVCPGGEAAMTEAARLMLAAGGSGTRRLVPSLNALVEKVKLVDAALEDWAIEMAKVLLLASAEAQDLDRVLLFDGVDHGAGVISWVRFDGTVPVRAASPLAAYRKLVARTNARPARHELRIDRAWAVEAVRAMIGDAN